MQLIDKALIQSKLDEFSGHKVFVHLETTRGAYAAYREGAAHSFGGFIRNAKVPVIRGKITGNRPYRVGLKLESGWIYAEGLTHCAEDEQGRLLLYGFDEAEKLSVALQLSLRPFS